MNDDNLQISTHKLQDNTGVIYLSGVIDDSTYSRLQQTLDELMDQQIYKLVVDLSQVYYLSRAGAFVFTNAFRRTRENKGKLVLVNPKLHVEEALESVIEASTFPVAKDIMGAFLLI